jgi:hypothetical protein
MINKPRKNTRRERAWKLMRSMGNYILADIAILAEADLQNIRHYHQCLVKAGYARQVGIRKQEGRPGFDKVYRLIKNTGPKPPIQKALRFVFDPNSGDYWAEDPEIIARVTAAVLRKSKPNATVHVKVRPGSPLDLVEEKHGRRCRVD